MKKENYVTDLFKEYCELMYDDDNFTNNGANFNLLQDVFSHTELFDISMLPSNYFNKKYYVHNEGNNTIRKYKHDFFKGLSLPFMNNFIKAITKKEGYYISLFIREYQPNILTGNLTFSLDYNGSIEEFEAFGCFHIDTEKGVLIPRFELHAPAMTASLTTVSNETITYTEYEIIQIIMNILNVVTNLPKHTVVSDTPKSSVYYPKKKASGIRVTNRPIYYIFPKNEEVKKEGIKRIKPIGHLEYTHSFKVRGHWRRINQHSIGKNRNGEYKVYGFTFVKEYVKGEGELVKRVRVLKS